MINFLKRIFWLCFSLYMFYFSYQVLMKVPGFSATKNTVVSIVEKDIIAAQDMVSGTTGVEINIVEKPKDLTNGRVKYPKYDWKYDYANQIESFSYHYLFGMEEYDTITWASNGRCINADEERYFFSQFKSIVEVFIYEKLPSDNLTATDAQIDAATNWKDAELENLIKPIQDNC